MPTPRDSTDALVLERERSTHTTCPPEDDRPRQWRAAILERIGRTPSSSTAESGESRHPEDLAIEGESQIPSDATPTRPEDKIVENVVSTEPAGSKTPLVGASPPSSHGDEKDDEKLHPTTPTSSVLDLPYSIRYGIQSTRVCPFIC